MAHRHQRADKEAYRIYTYQNVILEGYTITLEDGYTYNPYDFPRMPYAQDGLLYVLP